MIEFKNVSIGYEASLFEIDNCQLEKGRIYALLGKNGIGKSTLLKTICKEIELLKGDILIHNQSISQIKTTELPEIISFVSSKFPDVNYLNVRDFLALGRFQNLSPFGRIPEKDKNKIREAIEIFEIQHLCEKFTNEISDGEKQIIAIAKAFIQDTPFIVLDEPTSFLDYANKNKILHLLQKICVNHNKTILLSSHDIDILLENKDISYLLITPETKRCSLHSNPVSKEKILNTCFNF